MVNETFPEERPTLLSLVTAIMFSDYFSIYILGIISLKMKNTKTEISTFVISIYSPLVLIKLNQAYQDLTEI